MSIIGVMEVTTEPTPVDYKTFLIDYHFNRNKLALLIKLLLLSFVLGFFFYNSEYGKTSFSWVSYSLFTLRILPVLFIIGVCIPYGIEFVLSNTIFNKIVSINAKINITAYSTGINTENENNAEFFKWEQIRKIVITPRYVVIFLKDKRLLLIKKKDFENDESVKLFIYKINNGWVGTEAGIKHVRKSNSPSYLWGLIGIVPIIGAVNGVIMMLMAVFQYKDYKYFLIGLLGVTSTYGFIEYTNYTTNIFMHSPQSSKDFADEAQKRLNDLVKSVEFYKFENKQYPDSLQQLEKAQPIINIQDPILAFRHLTEDVNKQFYFKRIGDKYTLFSVGLDEVPHTKDDIYPQVNIADTSKCGLIKQ